ncbi:hypothetical protein MMC12_002852 [Toensbergia leucococca]|nr:hypothetical protein [Toensbergia leucococca]
MGLVSTTSQSLTTQIPSTTAPSAPNRSARASCWASRDAFFACLDANNITDSIKDAEGANRVCAKENEILGRDCAASWRRVMEFNKKQTLERLKAEGARPMPDGLGPPKGPAGA